MLGQKRKARCVVEPIDHRITAHATDSIHSVSDQSKASAASNQPSKKKRKAQKKAQKQARVLVATEFVVRQQMDARSDHLALASPNSRHTLTTSPAAS